jgi:hypothetical protein
VAPTQLLGQCPHNLPVGEDLGKLNHPKENVTGEALSKLLGQLSRQCRDNLFAVLGSLIFQNLGLDPVSDVPVE